MHSGCDAGVAAEEGAREIAEGSFLHFRTPCEGEAHGKGAAQAAWLSSHAAHDIFFRAG